MLKFKCKDCNNIFASEASEEQERNKDAGTGFYDSPNNYDMGKRPQGDEFIWPADTWLPRGTEEEESQDPTNVMAAKSVSYGEAWWLAPDGKVFKVTDKDPKHETHIGWIGANLKLLEKQYNFDIPFNITNFKGSDDPVKNAEWDAFIRDIEQRMFESGWIRALSNKSTLIFQAKSVDDVQAQEDFIFSMAPKFKNISIGDAEGYGLGEMYTKEFLEKGWEAFYQGRLVASKRFSKKAYYSKAKCPVCGEYKDTDKTPKQRAKYGWECVDCLKKRIEKWDKKAFLKISKPKSGYVDNGIGYTCGRCEYFNAEKERCKLVEGTIKSFGCCNFWDGGDKEKDKGVTATKGSERALTKEEAVYIEYPGVDYRCDECVFFDPKAKTCTKVEGEIAAAASCNLWQPIPKKEANLNKKAYSEYWIDPDGEVFNQDAETHADWVANNAKMLKKYYNILVDYDDNTHHLINALVDKGWTRVTSPRFIDAQFLLHVKDFNNLDRLNDFVAEHFDPEDKLPIAVGTDQAHNVFVSDPFPSLQQEVNKALQQKRMQPAAFFKKELNKQAAQVHMSISPEDKEEEYTTRVSVQFTVDGKEIGKADLSWEPWFKKEPDENKVLYLDGIELLPEFRGKGFGREAYNLIADYAKKKGFKRVDLSSEGDAARFWEHLKFKPFGKKDPEYPYKGYTKKLSKKDIKARLPSRFWIAPDGVEFEVAGIHPTWVKLHPDVLEHYGLQTSGKHYSRLYNEMIDSGWVRVSNEPAGNAFTIQVKDLRNIPSFLDDFIAKYHEPGERIVIGTEKSGDHAVITDPFPSIQKAVNKALRNPVNAMLKKADISGKAVNDILKLITQTGGATYSLQQGSLVGQNAFAVSTHKDREQIVPGVDYNNIEDYLVTNEDLLSQSDKSLGAWSHEGKVYLDVVSTVPTKEEALRLAHENQQLAIFDLAKMEEISVGIPAMSKKAEEQVLPQNIQDEIASVTSPVYNIALNNFASAVKRGHSKDRALDYAVDSVKNLEKIDSKKLIELANTYLTGLV